MEAVERVAAIRRVTFAGVGVNLVLTAAKFVGGLVWSSQALVADAVHSLSDLVTDFALIVGVKYWEAPADEDHPYGHGKIQALVTLFIGGVLALVAFELGKHAVETFRAGGGERPGLLAFVMALVSIVLKEWLYRWTRRVARLVKSPALEANAWHHRSDAISSVPVAVSVALAFLVPSLWWADAVGAMIVSVFILRVAWEIVHPALQELTDAGIDDKSAAVQRVAEAVEGVREVHQCRARRYGGAFHADLHVMVDHNLSLVEAHGLSHRVKDAILASDLDVTDVIIHIEPVDGRLLRCGIIQGKPERQWEQGLWTKNRD